METVIVCYNETEATRKTEIISNAFPNASIGIRGDFVNSDGVNTEVIALDINGPTENEIHAVI